MITIMIISIISTRSASVSSAAMIRSSKWEVSLISKCWCVKIKLLISFRQNLKSDQHDLEPVSNVWCFAIQPTCVRESESWVSMMPSTTWITPLVATCIMVRMTMVMATMVMMMTTQTLSEKTSWIPSTLTWSPPSLSILTWISSMDAFITKRTLFTEEHY